MNENDLSGKVIGIAMRVHTELGPGLFESAYKECLMIELKNEGLLFEQEKVTPLIYRGKVIDKSYKIDLLIENKLVLELKCVDFIQDIHFSQILTYLRLGNYKLGLIINFKSLHLKDGIKRVINGKIE